MNLWAAIFPPIISYTKTMEIQTRKLELIWALIQVNDLAVLEKLEQILIRPQKGDADWWGSISEGEKQAIDEGLAQAERGEVISHQEVRESIEGKFGKWPGESFGQKEPAGDPSRLKL